MQKSSFLTEIRVAIVAIVVAFPGHLQGQTFLTNGLVAYYPFDGSAVDASGNGNTGIVRGAATFGIDRFGRSNSCLSLPGTSGAGSGVEIPSLANLPYEPATYTAWFQLNGYPSSSYAVMPLVGRDDCGSQSQGVVCLYSEFGEVTNQFRYYTGAGGPWMKAPAPINQWCQVAFTVDAAGNANFFLNGTNVSIVGTTPGGEPYDFWIGSSDTNACENGRYVWNGQIDDVRIYNRALSTNEIEELYQYEAGSACPAPTYSASATPIVVDGFVVGATIIDGGCGFSNAPLVLIEGGGGTGATATATISNGTVVHITITDAGINYTSTPTMIIGTPPMVLSAPQPVTVDAHNAAAFSVSAVGGQPLAYQWSLNGTNISGATLSSLYLSNVVETNLGAYSVLVTNYFGSTNGAAQLSMYPFLDAPFQGLDTLWGYTNVLSVLAWGTGPLSFQWFDNGVAIDGATNQSLAFTGIEPTNSGLYYVVVTSPLGAVTNTPEQVVVQPSGIALGLSPRVKITGVAGQNYIIQRTTNLADTNSWETITNVALQQPVQVWVDSNIDTTAPGYPVEFYRVLPGQ